MSALLKYPDEPHPDDQWAWKRWWVKLCFEPKKPLTQGALVWIHQCWLETKARWCVTDRISGGVGKSGPGQDQCTPDLALEADTVRPVLPVVTQMSSPP